MKYCKIIRSIIVGIVILFLFTLICFDIKSIIKVRSVLSAYVKIIYIAVYGVLILLYSFLKKRLKNKIKNNRIIYMYRYLYIGVIIFVSRMIMVYGIRREDVVDGTMYNIILTTILAFVDAICIKRIVYNVTSSETLSGIAAITYAAIPQALIYATNYLKYDITLTLILLYICVMLIVVDEIAQKRLKSKKYIYLSSVLSGLIILMVVFKASYIYPVFMSIIFLLTIRKSDFTHFSFRWCIKKANKRIKDMLYKIERIIVPKKVIVFLIQLVGIIIGVILSIYILKTNEQFIIINISNRIYMLLKETRYLYLVIFSFIIILDILSIILKRNLEVKQSIINASFILISVLTVFTYNGVYFNNIFDAILVLKLMLSIGNIYYNREEKIKLLNEKN